jgi:hypothetical protein
MSPRFVHVGKEAKGGAAFLLAALPALGAVLTALAITGDVVGRMARNHPVVSFGAFGSAALAVFLGAVAAFALPPTSRSETRAVHVGVAILGAALLCAVYAGIRTWGDRTQPTIGVKVTRTGSVAVSVFDTGLRSSDHVRVEVARTLGADVAGETLYSASLGPDAAGKVADTIDLALPAGDIDDVVARAWVGEEAMPCLAHESTTGCVRVHVPRRQEWPQLAATWETFVRVPRLVVSVQARNLPAAPMRPMTLLVLGLVSGQPADTLAVWSLAPDGDGAFRRRLAVVVGHGYDDVCVVASTSDRSPACPAPLEAGTVWTELAVPPTS